MTQHFRGKLYGLILDEVQRGWLTERELSDLIIELDFTTENLIGITELFEKELPKWITTEKEVRETRSWYRLRYYIILTLVPAMFLITAIMAAFVQPNVIATSRFWRITLIISLILVLCLVGAHFATQLSTKKWQEDQNLTAERIKTAISTLKSLG